jgi:hypothetical protein
MFLSCTATLSTCRSTIYLTTLTGTCMRAVASLPSVLDPEAAGVAELLGIAGHRHGAERRAAQVEVNGLPLARAVGVLVRQDHGHRGAGARRVLGVFHLEKFCFTQTTAAASFGEWQ